MSESLVEKLNRMQDEIDSLIKRPIAKPVNYQEGISLLEDANKNLDRILGDLNKRYALLEQELKSLKNKKPVKQVDYSEDIKKLNGRIDLLVGKNKPTDHSKELEKINSQIKSIKDKSSNKKEINIKEEIENIVNLNYVNRLYNRNK